MGYHFVPQRYLRRFQDREEPGTIWIHDKTTGAFRRLAIKSVAQAKQFYPVETERRLAADVENPANAVIEKLVAGDRITENEREAIAVFVGTMACRVPTKRRRSRDMVPDSLSQVIDGYRHLIRTARAEGVIPPELLDRRSGEINAAEAKFAKNPPQVVLDLVNSPWPSVRFVTVFREMAWRVLSTAGPQFFVTSDNPAFGFQAEGFGWGTIEGELCLPLSTTHVLHGSWQGPRRSLYFGPVNQRSLREINKRLVSTADRFVFYHRPAPWVLALLAKGQLSLSRMRWPNARFSEPPTFDSLPTETYPVRRPATDRRDGSRQDPM
jgi:hypothetical protein